MQNDYLHVVCTWFSISTSNDITWPLQEGILNLINIYKEQNKIKVFYTLNLCLKLNYQTEQKCPSEMVNKYPHYGALLMHLL